MKEVKLLGLSRLTLHSARIGAAIRGAEAGLGRESIKTCGGWRSDAVDGYVRLKELGVAFFYRRVESLECLERLGKSESLGCLKVRVKRHFFSGDEGVGRGVLLQGAEETVGLLFVTGACHVFIITFHLIFSSSIFS